MAILTSLWGTLLGNRTSRSGIPLTDSLAKPGKTKFATNSPASPASPAAKSKAQKAIPASGSLAASLANHNPNHIEKHKLRSTRTQMEAQPVTKLDLNDLRARIHSDSQGYIDMRQRQKNSISHWFGKRTTGIDEVALTERLAAPVPAMPVNQEEIDLSLNFGDIHLPDYYDSQLVNVEPAYAVAEAATVLEEFDALPPPVAVDYDIPELEELLARLQIMEAMASLEENLALDPLSWSAMEQYEISSMQSDDSSECYLAAETPVCAQHHADLHLVTSLALISPVEEIDEHAPVEMIKHRSKAKKSRRARNKEAAKMKAEA